MADHQRSSPYCAGWDRRDAVGEMSSAAISHSANASHSVKACVGSTATSPVGSSASFSVQKELGQWKFARGIMCIMQEVFSMPASLLIVPPNEKSEIEKLVSTIYKKEVITIQAVLPQLLDLCKDEVTVDEVSNVLFLRNKIVHENTMLSNFEINNTIDIENKIIALLKAKIDDTYGV